MQLYTANHLTPNTNLQITRTSGSKVWKYLLNVSLCEHIFMFHLFLLDPSILLVMLKMCFIVISFKLICTLFDYFITCDQCLTFSPSLSLRECYLLFKGFFGLVFNVFCYQIWLVLKSLKIFLIINEWVTPPWDLELVFRALLKVSFEPLELSLMGLHQSMRTKPKTNHLGLPLLLNNFLKTSIWAQKPKSLSAYSKKCVSKELRIELARYFDIFWQVWYGRGS